MSTCMEMNWHAICLHVGQPIAWCISDQETAEVIEAFLKSIHDRSPFVSVTAIMTDDGITQKSLDYYFLDKIIITDNSGWKAANQVYGSSLRQLLCHWHIHR